MKPVEQALGKAPNVQSAKLRKSGSLYFADVVLKKGTTLALSGVDKALEEANRAMGDQMGTKYEIDESLDASAVHLYRTKAKPDEAKLKESLGKVKGFQSVWVSDAGFGLAVDGAARVSDVRKTAGVEITDILFAPAKDGARYRCETHPDAASATPMDCPSCKKPMAKVAAGKGGKTTASSSTTKEGEKCPSCGAGSAAEGCKKGCGMCKKKCGTCGGKGCGGGGGG